MNADLIELGIVLGMIGFVYWLMYEPPKQPYIPQPGDHPFDFYLNE